MRPDTYDPQGRKMPGPYTNVVAVNLAELGLRATLFNDTDCLEPISTIDTNGCQVVGVYVSPAVARIRRCSNLDLI